jgi:hypothetical protein
VSFEQLVTLLPLAGYGIVPYGFIPSHASHNADRSGFVPTELAKVGLFHVLLDHTLTMQTGSANCKDKDCHADGAVYQTICTMAASGHGQSQRCYYDG